MGRLAEFDASDDLLVAIAHDGGLLDVIDFFPNGMMNEWQAKWWKEKSHWRFWNELPVEGGPMPPIAPGLMREREIFETIEDLRDSDIDCGSLSDCHAELSRPL